MSAVRPSPARAEAPEPDVWIPILDLGVLEALETQIDPMLLRELDRLELRYVEPAAPEPEPRMRTGRHHRALHWGILAAALTVVVAGVPYFLRSPAQRRVTLDVDGVSSTRLARADDVAGLLASAGVALAPGDRITPTPAAALHDGATVRVVRAFPISVDVDGARRSVRTTATTVKALRRELRIHEQIVAVDPPARLRRNAAVVFRTPLDVPLPADGATAALVTEDAAVPFEVHEQPDPTLPEGERRTVQSGIEGIDRTTYELSYSGDAVVGKDATGTVRVAHPQPQIVAVGVRPVGGATRQSGRATWYATLYQPGTCAHLHIPFGTVVRVVDAETGGTTTCRVADRGPEAWTGHIIDLSPDVFQRLQPLSAGVVDVHLEY